MKEQKDLIDLFESYTGEKIISITPLPESGSARKYFRLISTGHTLIGAYNPDKRENNSFVYLTKHFGKHKLSVPSLFKTDLKKGIYLLEDLGDTTLFSLLGKKRDGSDPPGEIINYYHRALEALIKFQVTSHRDLKFKNCYPRPEFDHQSIKWDLNYFKYYFLKLANIPFDEEKLENDFSLLGNHLLEADHKYFMYRDFNSRNIMIKNDELYFIDYQGGRKGALQYDVASLLYDSKADLPQQVRDELLLYYLNSLSIHKKINLKNFKKYFYPYVLVRLLQMFGAYGYRGYFEGKAHFLKSIPYAIRNLEYVLTKIKIKIPELKVVLERLITSEQLKQFNITDTKPNKLTVRINSFSYRDKMPFDFTGNGGGFVFDCRAIPNPGRIDEYKHLTGKNRPVQDFLDAQPEAQRFLKESFDIVEQSVVNYMGNKWTDLMVNFGCTGGQHRSVYCAEKLAAHLQKEFEVNVKLTHTKI
ncbi:MAG: RNase adapter RapZ [Bacteroidota bacterium]